jgi:U1 small nuclear ribonucleoprotein
MIRYCELPNSFSEFWGGNISMSAIGLPVNLLAHFVPRPPISFEKPLPAKLAPAIEPMSKYVMLLEKEAAPPREIYITPKEQVLRKQDEKRVAHEMEISFLRDQYKPSENPKATSDPYKTLFVGRMAYETNERTLRRVFEEWGRISDIKIVTDTDGRSKGYAFIEYEHERDLKDAYKHADGIKVDGRNVLVDVERGRTVPDWFPRRLGGGRGPGRVSTRPRQKKRKIAHATSGQRGWSYPESKRPRSPTRDTYRNPRGYDSRDYSRKSSYNW